MTGFTAGQVRRVSNRIYLVSDRSAYATYAVSVSTHSPSTAALHPVGTTAASGAAVACRPPGPTA